MRKIECRYLSKLDLINSLIDYIENSSEEIDIDTLLIKLKKSQLFYRSCLAHLDDC